MSQVPSPQELAQAVQQLFAQIDGLQGQLTGTRQRLYNFETRSELERLGVKPRLPVEFRSQFGEDLLLWDLFRPKLDGFYIEVGAYDGKSLSVSWIFDAVGWDGLLIEALPDRHAQARANRPHARVEHAALGRRGSKGTTVFTEVEGGAGGMFSFLSTNAEHDAVITGSGGRRKNVTVPLTTMDDLLAASPPRSGRVDFAVIDVEGGEIDVLEGFDLERWKPRALMLEDNGQGRDATLERYMAGRPYMQIGWVAVNRVYVRTDDAEIMQRVRELTGQAG